MAKKEDKKAKTKGSASSKKVDKKAKSKSDEKSKSKKSDKELTPLEKARIARQNGKGKKPAKKKNALPIFKAPEDFKPHFVSVMLKTEKDGLLSSSIKATRYQGRYDPDADDKKKFDLATFDPKTVNGILSRFAMTTFVTNVAKRLPANTVYQILLRVNRKSADGSLSVLFKGMEVATKSAKTGKVKFVAMEKSDAVYRKFRKASRILPAAFKDVQTPPKRVRGANKAKDDGDDE